MHRVVRRLVLGLGAIAVAACADSTSPTAAQSLSLNAARAKWALAKTSYQFTYKASCFCVVTDPVRLTVVNDSIVSAVLVSTGAAVDKRAVMTIDQLFGFIEAHIGHAAQLHVTYDDVLGFPKQIDFDINANAADDEGSFTASDVVFPGAGS